MILAVHKCNRMEPLIELAPTQSRHVKPGRRLVLSGLLAEQAEGVMAAYTDDFVFDTPAVKDGWGVRCAVVINPAR